VLFTKEIPLKKMVLTVGKCTFSLFLFLSVKMCQKKLFFRFGTKYFTTRGAKRFMKLSVGTGNCKRPFPPEMVLTPGKPLRVIFPIRVFFPY